MKLVHKLDHLIKPNRARPRVFDRIFLPETGFTIILKSFERIFS
ncbi:unnamed protein product [Debaryomyces tyrocola]|nr:unnamed protein product [Debaryomyces tyrocola]